MRTVNRRATRDQLTTRNGGRTPDCGNGTVTGGGTITGGPMERIDLMEILARVSRGGAVSGAAQAVAGGLDMAGSRDHGIALSDGSRIAFASITDTGIFPVEGPHASSRASRRVLTPGDNRVLTPNTSAF